MKPWSLSVKAVVFDDSGRCLLIRRSPASRHFAGCWEWPGGKTDPGEDFVATLLRETREETGLDVEITGLAGTTAFEMPAVNVVLLCMETRVVEGELRLSDEHDDSAWVPLRAMGNRSLAPVVREFMLDYARNRGGGGKA